MGQLIAVFKEGVTVTFSADQITVTNLSERDRGFINPDFNGLHMFYSGADPNGGVLTSIVEDPASDPPFAAAACSLS